MKILAAECSATAASCAISENGKILASSFSNLKITHSQTLMPMIKSVLNISGISVSDIDAFAVTNGPGSFTGIRIGISAVKGLAVPRNKPCVAVSTLACMAVAHREENCILCCVMDARCSQVYNAMFEVKGGETNRLCSDRAVTCNELAEEIKTVYDGRRIIVTGDGTEFFMPFVCSENVKAANILNRYQNAECAAIAAEKIYESGGSVSPHELHPFYLRLPQAERELKAKSGNI